MPGVTFLVIDKVGLEVVEGIGLKRLCVLTPWLLRIHPSMASYAGFSVQM